jgi:hypothetical protein
MYSDSEDDPIGAFFARFPSFSYQSSTDWRQLGPFHKLATHFHWKKPRRDIEYERLKSTWTEVVESEFSGSSISHYQSLCRDLDIDPIPDSVTECKNALREVFVNIVDLVQYRKDLEQGREASKPRTFRTLGQLRHYASNTGKYYPKENAKAEMLRELLKELM